MIGSIYDKILILTNRQVVLIGLKVHLVIHSLTHHPFFSKVQIFTSVEAFRYMFVGKIFLSNSFVTRNNRQIIPYHHGDLYNRMRQMQPLGIHWKFGNKIILSITELCHENSKMLGLQNGPLRRDYLLFPQCFWLFVSLVLVIMCWGKNKSKLCSPFM